MLEQGGMPEKNMALIRNSLIVGLAIAGVAIAMKLGYESDPIVVSSDYATNKIMATQDLVGGAPGGVEMEVAGHKLVCGRMNNPAYPDTYDSSWPVALTAWGILGMIGEPGIDPGPYMVIKGDDVPVVVPGFSARDWTRDGNGAFVCINN